MRTNTSIFYLAMLLTTFWGANATIFAQTSSSEKELIRGVRETKNIDKKIIRLIELGEFYGDKNLEKTQVIRDKIKQFSQESHSKITLDIALFDAYVFRLERNYKLFYASIQPFENKDLSKESIKKQQKFNQYLGFYCLVNDQLEKADSLFQKSLKLAISEKNYSEICYTYCYLSNSETIKKNKEAALKFIDKAFEATKQAATKTELATCYYFQSAIFDFFGQPDIAISKLLLSYNYAKSAENNSLLSLLAKRIGDKQILIQNLTEAIYYFNEAYTYSKKYSDAHLQGIALVALSNAKRLQKKYSESLGYSNQAFKAFEKTKGEEGMGRAELNLARIFFDKESFELAIVHLDKSLPYFEKGLNDELKAEVYELKGLIANKNKKFSEALLYYNQSIEILRKTSNQNKAYELYPLVAEIYKLQGNNQKALIYLEKFVGFSDKNNKNIAARKIAELNEMYRTKQRDALITKQNGILEKQKRERELTKTKLENVSLRSNMLMYVIIAFVIIIVLATIIGISRSRQTSIQLKQREAEMSQILLRTQMNPHFIFNAMSVIQSYIFESDMKNSSKFLVNFSKLIRLILENSSKAFIHLETELEILQKYLETQKKRFEDRFEFEIICPEELLFDNVQIPPMITQPFVENSIEHGQLHTIPNGKITIHFSKKNEMLLIRVDDNGIGRDKSEKPKNVQGHKSMAMDITRNRIEMINEKHNSAGYLLISDLDVDQEIGTRVLISLPYIVE